MDRCRDVSMEAAMLLLLLLALTLPAACQPGFQSINCGGEAYKDANTNITWDGDPFNESSNGGNVLISGEVGKVNSTTHVLTTLRYFPVNSRNAKFCYTLGQDLRGLSGHKCLLRASFLYGNYDGLNQPPDFVLMLDSDVWTTVNTSSSPIPKVYELIFVSNQEVLSICLAPSITSNHTPFISTLELRILENSMYNTTGGDGTPGGIQQGYGLMLWKRINYGSLTQADIRFGAKLYKTIFQNFEHGIVKLTSFKDVPNMNAPSSWFPPPYSLPMIENFWQISISYWEDATMIILLHKSKSSSPTQKMKLPRINLGDLNYNFWHFNKVFMIKGEMDQGREEWLREEVLEVWRNSLLPKEGGDHQALQKKCVHK